MILAIETSCDETSVALVSPQNGGVVVHDNLIFSSAEIQAKYGGVVPELAAREQVKAIVPLLKEITASVQRDQIESIAVTIGPGLMGSLLVGVESAKALSWAWKMPVIAVNHVMAHLMACFIIDGPEWSPPQLPAVGLIVSGGHTDLIYIKNLTEWSWIGGTRDDAAGEAFDKTAVILDLGYPGGPAIQRAIESTSKEEMVVVPKLPRPMINEPGLEMSFSGLKAAVNKATKNLNMTFPEKASWAKEFNLAVVDVLTKKLLLALEKYPVKSVLVAGGVSANEQLRSSLKEIFETRNEKLFLPQLKYCGDNAAMIGAAAVMSPDKTMRIEGNPGLGMTN